MDQRLDEILREQGFSLPTSVRVDDQLQFLVYQCPVAVVTIEFDGEMDNIWFWAAQH